MHHNPFIYEQIDATDSSCAPIPARLTEQYSQCGEDVIVKSLLDAFKRTRFDLQPETSIYLEIGANHPISGSNTFLLYRHGYRGVLVEANPKLIPDLKRLRPDDIVVNTAITQDAQPYVDLYISNQHELSSLSKEFVTSWHEGKIGLSEILRVPAMRINDLLKQHALNKIIAFLSIDIEGLDYQILEDIDFTEWRPMLIQAEPSDHFVKDGSQSIIALLESRNYMLIGITDVNLLFVDKLIMNEINFSESPPLITYLQKQLAESRLLSRTQNNELREIRNGLGLVVNEINSIKASRLWRWSVPLRKMIAGLRVFLKQR